MALILIAHGVNGNYLRYSIWLVFVDLTRALIVSQSVDLFFSWFISQPAVYQ